MGMKTYQRIFETEEAANAAARSGSDYYSEWYVKCGPRKIKLIDGREAWAVDYVEYYG